jgi:NADH dehydrogenase
LNDDLGIILVTGANGQLGRGLIGRLAKRSDGTKVRAVVRSERAAETLRSLPESVRPEIVILDYADADALGEAARGCRFAVHLVGIIKETSNSRYQAAHEASCRSLVQAAAAAGLGRIVYISILGTDSNSPNTCLRSKGRAEQMLIEGKTAAVVLRVPMVLGRGDRTSEILRHQAMAKLLPMIGGGRSYTQPIASADVLDAIIAALTRTGLEGAALDLAGPESLPARDLVRRVGEIIGRRPTILPIPLFIAMGLAWIASRLSSDPIFTPSMLGVIHLDDRIDPEPARARLGIDLTPLDETLRRAIASEGAP